MSMVMSSLKELQMDESFELRIENKIVPVHISSMSHFLFAHGEKESNFEAIHPSSLFGILRNRMHNLELAIAFAEDCVNIIVCFYSHWGDFEEFYNMSYEDLDSLTDHCSIKALNKRHDWTTEGF